MQSPYNYSFDDTSETYQFPTKNNIVYRVAFVEDHTLNSISPSEFQFDNIYQIVVEKITDGIEPLDHQVSLTIDLIIHDFFSNIENALIYVCSNEKGKEAQRFNSFNRWYEKSQHKSIITKVDNIIHLEKEVVIYTSLLCHNDNPNISNILNAFKQIEDALNTDK